MNLFNKFTLLSLATSSLLAASQTFELKSGWNLIGFVEDGGLTVSKFLEKAPDNSVEKFVTQIDGAFKIYDPTKSYLQKFQEFEGGRGYWVKVKSDFNITMTGDNIAKFPSLNAGWNLIATSIDDTVSDKIETLKDDGIKVEKFVTQINGAFKIYDPTKSYLQKFQEFDKNLGYWVKVQKVAETVTTTDGYTVKLYIDNENSDLSTIATTIAGKTIAELGDMSEDKFSGVSNMLVSKTDNGLNLQSTYLEPRDSGFKVALESEVDGALNYDKQIEKFATAGTSLYVYEVTSGGAPKIISEVAIYSNNSGKKGSLLGVTSATGFLYISEVSTDSNNPTKVIIEKDGYESSVQTLYASQGGANYIFISKNTGSSFRGVDSSNPRVLGRELFASTDGFWKSKNEGDQRGLLYFPESTKISGSDISIKLSDSSIKSFEAKSEIDVILGESGYLIQKLGEFKVSATQDGYEKNNLNFSEITNQADDSFKMILGLKLSNELEELIAENGKSIVEDYIEIYSYKNSIWEKLGDSNISEKIEIYFAGETIPGSYSAGFRNGVKEYFAKGSRNKNAVLVVDGSLYTGPSSLFAIYKKAVNENPDLTYNTYNLNVKVLSSDNQLLPNSMITLTRGSGNTEISQPVNLDSTASFQILLANGALEDFSISVLEGNHYPLTKNMNISNLNLVDDSSISETNITINLNNPPQYATVKGEVENGDGTDLKNATVKLFYPISMADVITDATNIIDSKKVLGVEVASIPNAKYSWYIKVHKDEVTTQNLGRVLGRVSEDRWTLVQQASAEKIGNFLPYNKIVAQALAPILDGDADDIKIVASGKFDVALQVEHDIDGDGKRDFTELSASQTSLENSSGRDFVANPDANYSVELGYLSTYIDVDKLYKDSSQTQGTTGYDYISVDGGDFLKTIGTSGNVVIKTYGSDDELEDVSTTDSDVIELTDVNNYDSRKNDISDFMNNIANLINIDDSNILSTGNRGGYLKAIDKTAGNHDRSFIEWSLILHMAIEDDDATLHYFSLQQQADGNFEWIVETNTGSYNAKDDYSKASVVKTSSSSKNLYMNNLSTYISSNKVLEKLAEPIGDVFKRLDINSTVSSKANKLMFNDGFSVTVILRDHQNTDSDAEIGAGKKIIFTTSTDLVFENSDSNKDLDLKSYVRLGDRSFQSPVMLDSQQEALTDRAGIYQFSVVPLQYGTMNSVNSLLRVEASRLGYYTSPATNVKRFVVDNTETGNIREDVVRVNLKISEKPLYSVTVNVRDKDTNQLIEDAIITIDGVKTAQNLLESESRKTGQGSAVTFENIIGGKGAKRVIRVKVEDETKGYMPIINTTTLNKDETINIYLRSSDVIPAHTAQISIKDVSTNYEKGIVTVGLYVYDGSDSTSDTLTEIAEVYTYLNGELIKNPIVSHDTGSTDFSFSIPLEIGENSLEFDVANLKGIATSSAIEIDYDPTIGTVKGKILGAESGGFVIVDLYTEDDLYLNSISVDEASQYILSDIEADKKFKLQAIQLDENFQVLKIGDLTPITVPVAKILTVDLTLQDIEKTAGFSGGLPVLDLIGEINDANIQENGEINVSFSISNFDKESNNSFAFISINDKITLIDKDLILETESDFAYSITNFEAQLDVGVNIFYVGVTNPDYSYDFTQDTELTWTPESSSLYSLTTTIYGCEAEDDNSTTCKTLEYAYVDLYNSEWDYLGTKESNEDGVVEFSNLLEGDYNIAVTSSDFELFKQMYSIPSELNVEVNLSEFSEDEIAISEFSIEPLEIPYDILVGSDLNLTATLNLFDSDDSVSNYSFEWVVTVTTNENKSETNLTGQTITLPTDAEGELNIQLTVTQTLSDEKLYEEGYSYIVGTVICSDGETLDATTNECVTDEPDDTSTLQRPPSTPTL